MMNPRSRYIYFVVFAYTLLALAWILFSNRQLLSLADHNAAVWMESLKDVLFALASATIFFLVLKISPDKRQGDISLLRVDANATTRRPRWLVYAVAVIITIAMLGLRMAIPVSIEQRPMVIMFMLPIILSALLGGLGPGLLSTLIAAAGIESLSMPYIHNALSQPYAQLQSAFLLINGVAVSILSKLLHRSSASQNDSRRLIDAVVSSTTDAIFVKDRHGRYLLANAAAADLIGKPLEVIIGSDDLALFDADSARHLMQTDQAIMAAGQVQTHEENLTFQHGQSATYLVTKGPTYDAAGRVNGLFGIARDISGQKNNEALLRANQAALKEAQRLAAVGSWEWDVPTDTHVWSEQIYQIYGRDPALPAAIYPEVMRYFTPESWERLAASVEQCLKDGGSYECDAEVVRPDGSLRWITARGEAVRDVNGEIVKLHGTVQDITERKRITLQAITSEERMLQVLNATSDGFWDWNLLTGEVYRSARYYQVVDRQPEEDSHDIAFFRNLIHPDDLARVMHAIESHKQGKTSEIQFDCRIVLPDGQNKWIRSRGRAVSWDKNRQPTRLVGILSDINERKQLDDDLRFILNEAVDAIWIADAEGRFLFANPAACQLTGHYLEHLQSMHIAELVAKPDLADLPAHLARLDQEQFIRREWQLRRVDGRVVSVELTTERMRDGRYVAFGRDLSTQKQAQVDLQNRERQLARVLEGSDQGYWDWNLQTNTFQVSARWEQMLGYAPGEMDVRVENWPALVHPDDLPLATASIERHLSGQAPFHEVAFRMRTKSAAWRWILTRGRVVEWDKHGQPLTMSGTHTDITERKIFELAQQQANVVFDRSYDGIMVISADRVITKVNDAFTRITGYNADEAVGRAIAILASAQHEPQFYREMWHSIRQHDFWRGELTDLRKNGESYTVLLSISAVRDAAGQIQHYIGVFSDISQIKAHEAELDKVANYDPLTGAPNRRLLSDRLKQSIVHAVRCGKSCAVCFLDLDGFKAINDQHGHETGDLLLIAITERLRGVLRADDTLARIGGDEFVLLLAEIHTPEECTLILDRVLSVVSQALRIGELLIHTSASIGVSLYPQDNVDPDTLLRHADQAMYLAKEAGKNRYQLFDSESDRKAQHHRQQLKTLRHALRDNQFVLYYQPKVDLIDGRIIGAEALIRWQHPERGLIPPAEFLPYIQGSDLEQAVGEWVMQQAMTQLGKWHAAGLTLGVSVNISANHLLQPDFHDFLQALLAQHHGVPSSCLELEVLESAAIGDVDQAITIMQRCRELGVDFSLDDFGTGYSSLIYLRKLPIDILKIDQSFVRDMLTDNDDLGIVESVIRLAAVFNRDVIAEGVETMAHGAKLCQLGCRLAQGYGIARPMAAEMLVPWSQQWQTDKPWQALTNLN